MKQNANTPASPHYRYTLFSKKKIKLNQWKRQGQERCQENEKNNKKKDAQA